MSLIDELHKLMKEKKYTYAYTAITFARALYGIAYTGVIPNFL